MLPKLYGTSQMFCIRVNVAYLTADHTYKNNFKDKITKQTTKQCIFAAQTSLFNRTKGVVSFFFIVHGTHLLGA